MFCYQVTEGQDGHDDDGRCRGDLLGLDHGQHLRHLAFPEEKKLKIEFQVWLESEKID
jgi:hypothetical protein